MTFQGFQMLMIGKLKAQNNTKILNCSKVKAYRLEKLIIKNLKKKLIISVKAPRLDTEGFYKICKLIGEIYSLDHTENNNISKEYKSRLEKITYKDESQNLFPGLNRVTAEKINNQVSGLDAGITNELGWHCNEWKSEKQWPFVALQGVRGTKGTATQILHTDMLYDRLSSIEKKQLQDINCIWGSTSAKDLPKEFRVMSSLPKAHKSIPQLSNYSRALKLKRPLISQSPQGIIGIHFSPAQVIGIENKSNKEFQEIRSWLIHKMSNKENYFTHTWEDGDLLFLDQTISLHRRIGTTHNTYLNNDILEKRLLHRVELNLNHIL